MRRVWKHIYRLDGCHTIVLVEQCQVARLCGRVAADIYYPLRVRAENSLDNICVHSGTRRVGDDDVGTTVCRNKLVCENIFHVSRKEERIVDAVDLRIDARILNRFGNIFDANDLPGVAGNEVGNGCAPNANSLATE